jgi:hypothetical protein
VTRDPTGKVTAPFPEEERRSCRFIAGVPHESQHKLKLTSLAVNAIILASPEYLRLSENTITFVQTDPPDSIPKPGKFSS